MTRVRYSFLIIFLFEFLFVSAQNVIGYSNGTVERKNGVRFGSGTKQGMAIYIPKEKAALLKGSTISSLQTAFGTSQTTDMQLFITKDLNVEPIYKQEISGAVTKWKEFELTTPYLIDGEAFYVGYTFNVGETYKPLLFDESIDFQMDYAWALNEGVWMNISHLGLGAPNIRLVVNGIDPFEDLIMKCIDADGFFKEGEAYKFAGQLFNFGTEIVQSFDIHCKVGNGDVVVYNVKDLTLAPGSTYDFVLPEYISKESGKLELSVEVCNVNSTVERDLSDNVVICSPYFYPSFIEKKILVETFTGQACGNCPTGHKALESAISANQDDYIVVSHHAGYNPDLFTTEEDVQYTWLYNSSSLYAPACMFNRSSYDEGVTSVVFLPSDSKLLKAAINRTQQQQPYVWFKLANVYDNATRKGTLSVDVNTCISPSDRQHRLNVFLIQDNIVGYQSNGGASYVHNHVFRDALTPTWGEPIQLIEGETVSYSFNYTIPEQIESTYYSSVGEKAVYVEALPEDMHLVVFVSDVSDNALQCQVHNATQLKVTDQVNVGVKQNKLKEACQLSVSDGALSIWGDFVEAQVFQMGGKIVNSLNPQHRSQKLEKGVYAVSLKCNDGTTRVHKVLIK